MAENICNMPTRIGLQRPAASWRIVAIAFIAQNCAGGIAFGSFGPLLASTEAHFEVSRVEASLLLSMVTIAIGVLTPVFGRLIQRYSARNGFIAGALFCAVGFFGLAFTSNYPIALVMYLAIGAGISLAGVLSPVQVISQWFDNSCGKMLAIVNLPVFMALSPILIAEGLPRYGRFAVLLAMASVFLVIIPLFALIPDCGPKEREHSDSARVEDLGNTAVKNAPLAGRSPTSSPIFWLMSLAVGLIAGAAVSATVHIIPFGRDRQLGLPEASLLLSTYILSGIPGMIWWGWFADRFGPLEALFASASCQSIGWLALIIAGAPGIYVLIAVLGFCIIPLTTLHGAAFSFLYGPSDVSRALGLSYALKLPFLFGFAPFIAFIYGIAGGYDVPFILIALSAAISAGCVISGALLLRRRRG